MSRNALSAVFLGIAIAVMSPAALADPVEAVTISGKAVLTMCRYWIVYRSCKPYDKIALPPRVAVGDRIRLTFGSHPKDYIFHVVEIRQKGEGCLLLSDVSKGAEDRERIEVARCQPIAKPALGAR